MPCLEAIIDIEACSNMCISPIHRRQMIHARIPISSRYMKQGQIIKLKYTGITPRLLTELSQCFVLPQDCDPRHQFQYGKCKTPWENKICWVWSKFKSILEICTTGWMLKDWVIIGINSVTTMSSVIPVKIVCHPITPTTKLQRFSINWRSGDNYSIWVS